MASRPVPLIDIIDTGTFDSAWYWLLLLLAWWWSGHRTMGVPHEVMVIAARRGGAMAAHVEALVRAEVARLSAIYAPRRGGAGGTGRLRGRAAGHGRLLGRQRLRPRGCA
ncbi:MAG: hypothetical protein KatS3mg118_2304 [Paracoccaceae bacterium]|nr:MAG: hypothetical protein KatS3mg118_2304 [Paracoccaceae bacterium]